MKGGIGQRVIGWGVTLVVLFAAMSMLFGVQTSKSFGNALMGAIGDGIGIVTVGLPKAAEHIKAVQASEAAPVDS